MWLLAICLSSLVKCLLKHLSRFLSWPVCFPIVAFLSSLYILDISPLSDIYIANISPQSVLSFHSLNSVFCRAEVFNFNEVQFISLLLHEL